MLAGQLELQLIADVARIKQDMDRMQSVVTRGAQGMQKALDDVRGTLQGLFGGVSAAGFGMWIKSAIDFQDQLNDLNKTTDIAIGKLAGISLMSKQTGSDLTGMAQSVNKLTMEMGKAPEKFARIGITAKEPLEAFKQLSEIFRGIEDPQLRAAVAAEALGKGWAAAAPALSEGAEAIGKMIERGEQLAGITARDAQLADEFNDSVSELQMSIMGTASTLTRSMLPMLTELVKSLTDVNHQANQADAGFNILTETMRAVIVLGGNVAFVIHGIAKELGILAAQGAAVLRGDFAQAAEIGRMARADAENNRAAFDAWQQRMMAAGKTAKQTAEDAREARRMLSAAQQAALRDFVGGGGGGKGGGQDEALKEAKRVAEERQKLRNKEAEEIAKFFRDQYVEEVKFAQAQAELIRKNGAEFERAQLEKVLATHAMVDAAQWELETHGLSRSAIAQLTLTRMEDAAAQKLMTALTVEEIAVINAQLNAQRKLIGIYQKGELRDANLKAAEEAATAWRQVGDAFVENLMNGGKSVAEYLKDLFRTLVLRPLLQPVGMGMAGVIGTLPTAANAGGTGLLGSVGSSLGFNPSSIASLFGGGGAGGSFASSVGAGLATDAMGATVLEGSAAATLGGGGISGALAAIPGWGWAMAGAALLAGVLGKKGGGPKVDGRFGMLNSGIGSGELDQSAGATVQGLQAQYDAIVKALGGTGGLQFGLGLSTDPKGTSSGFIETALSRGGSVEFSNLNRNAPRDSAQFQAAIQAQASELLLEALRRSNIPEQYADLLAGGTVEEIQAAVAKVQAAADERRALEERLFQSSATAEQKLTHAREAERAAISATNRELLERIYAEEDAREAAAKAAEQQEQMRDRFKAAVDTAQQNLRDAYERESDTIRDTITRHEGYVKSLKAFQQALTSGPLARLSPVDQYRADRAAFDQIVALVAGGDEEAIAGFQQVAERFAATSLSFNATNEQYFRDLEDIKRATETARLHAAASVDVARLQLNALNTQVGALINLNTSVLSVRDAIAALAAANMKAGTGAPPGTKAVPVAGGGGGFAYLPDMPVEQIVKPQGFQYGSADVLNKINSLSGQYTNEQIAAGLLDSGISLERVTSAYSDVFGTSLQGPVLDELVRSYQIAQNARANSHADGLSYVPYDNYPATLHRGERVATAGENEAISKLPGAIRELAEKVDTLCKVVERGDKANVDETRGVREQIGKVAALAGSRV